jgi:hypothetical protein
MSGLVLLHVEAFLDFDADPGLDGIVNVYEWTDSPQGLSGGDPPGPSEDGEYVPQLTFALKDFDRYEASAYVGQCILCAPPLPPWFIGGIGVGADLGTEYFDEFTFDYWDQGESAIAGDPDYIHNEPWHIASDLFHEFSDHFDPFGP